ncbi:hypothetical protein BWQ96_07892 [Gracilariopsis chorda]|uniref:Uncharacterized protein n=1 Tax=Gracilariopsis chorda TaxID=448386 RepID=A0A2V3IJX0_9FLOR|nr:hypothetical protein BWQ96_07892 [Gracilariopsis chorda]|eukprot:PXF42372.1 hypothetical protein BWQ96_07892 [Gracilariopsis chorda]
MVLRCNLCGCGAPQQPSVRVIFEFIALYLVGIYELIRQWFFSVPLSSDCNTVLQDVIRDQKLVIVLSGVTSGIGRELLHSLLRTSADVIALTHPSTTVKDPGCKQVMIDFESIESTTAVINKLLAELTSLPPRKAIYIHCAAVYNPLPLVSNGYSLTSVERTLLTNTFIPAAFIEGIASVVSGVVYIGSSSQKAASRFDIRHCLLQAAQSPYGAYPVSKLLSLLHIADWGVRTGKPCIVIHPGIVATRLYHTQKGLIGAILRGFVSQFAWNAETSATRIFKVLQRSRFFDMAMSGSRKNTVRITNEYYVYWDCVTMDVSAPPAQVPKSETSTLAMHIHHILMDSSLVCSKKPFFVETANLRAS